GRLVWFQSVHLSVRKNAPVRRTPRHTIQPPPTLTPARNRELETVQTVARIVAHAPPPKVWHSQSSRATMKSAPNCIAARSRLLFAPDRAHALHCCAPETNRPCPPTAEDFAPDPCPAKHCSVRFQLLPSYPTRATTRPL